MIGSWRLDYIPDYFFDVSPAFLLAIPGVVAGQLPAVTIVSQSPSLSRSKYLDEF